jgi:hypothetical protein
MAELLSVPLLAQSTSQVQVLERFHSARPTMCSLSTSRVRPQTARSSFRSAMIQCQNTNTNAATAQMVMMITHQKHQRSPSATAQMVMMIMHQKHQRSPDARMLRSHSIPPSHGNGAKRPVSLSQPPLASSTATTRSRTTARLLMLASLVPCSTSVSSCRPMPVVICPWVLNTE